MSTLFQMSRVAVSLRGILSGRVRLPHSSSMLGRIPVRFASSSPGNNDGNDGTGKKNDDEIQAPSIRSSLNKKDDADRRGQPEEKDTPYGGIQLDIEGEDGVDGASVVASHLSTKNQAEGKVEKKNRSRRSNRNKKRRRDDQAAATAGAATPASDTSTGTDAAAGAGVSSRGKKMPDYVNVHDKAATKDKENGSADAPDAQDRDAKAQQALSARAREELMRVRRAERKLRAMLRSREHEQSPVSQEAEEELEDDSGVPARDRVVNVDQMRGAGVRAKDRGDKGDKRAPPTGAAPPSGSGSGKNGGGNGSGPEFSLPKGLVPHGSNAPKLSSVVVIPSPARPLFPGLYYPCVLRDEKLIADLLAQAKKGLPYVGVFMTKQQSSDAFIRAKTTIQPVDKKNPSINADVYDEATLTADDIHKVGCFAQIYKMNKVEGGGLMLVLVGLRRIEVLGTRQTDPYLVVDVKHVDENSRTSPGSRADGSPKTEAESAGERDLVKALTLEIMATLKEVVKGSHVFSEQLSFLINNIDWANPASLADICATITTIDNSDMQQVLATYDLPTRLRLALELLKKERDMVHLQQDIHKKVEASLGANQRKYLLQEQLKSIKKELGLERDEKEELKQKYMKMVEGKQMPAEVQKVWDDEMAKLSHLEPTSMEFNVTRNYIDWLAQVPWGVCGEECYDLPQAEAVLNEDHYGLEDVKDRIVEFVAVSKLRGSAQGRILLLVGPPGVGKTSIGKSVARALGREFFRFSVGGMHDATEIKGHRRTYVGAMPGKLVQALKKTGVSNPVVLIDEIDKLGRGAHGDPASALLEALDPEQNNSFLDHYLDVPVDLSKVLFVCTANSTDSIPGPLLDRMAVIRISGYVEQEKAHIARHYLCPTVANKSGVGMARGRITTPALTQLIKWYCRESGVRNLNKYIEQIYAKVAVELVRGVPAPVVVDTTTLSKYVGQEVYTQERMYSRCPVGVVMGLAWSSVGGSVLYLETVATAGKGMRVEPLPGKTATGTSASRGNVVDTTAVRVEVDDGVDSDINKRQTPEDVDESSKHKPERGVAVVDEGKKDDDEHKGSGQLKVTGQLGDVMKESTAIAHTLAKVFLNRLAHEQLALKDVAVTADGRIPGEAARVVRDINGAPVTTRGSLPVAETYTVQPVGDSVEVVCPLWCEQPLMKPASQRSGVYTKAKSVKQPAATDSVTQSATESVADALKKAMDPLTGAAVPPARNSTDTHTQHLHSAMAEAFAQASAPLVLDGVAPAVGEVYASIGARMPRSYIPVPDADFFKHTDLHLHIPQGAVPKDGPSAGIALLSSLLSVALQRSLVPDVAMTGELCLTGRVLAIGGLKEKIIAARRAGVRTVIVPRANAKDVAELPPFVTSGMTVFLVDTAEEVIRIVFGAPWALGGDRAVTAVQKYPEMPEEELEDMIEGDKADEGKDSVEDTLQQRQEREERGGEGVNQTDESGGRGSDKPEIGGNNEQPPQL